MGGAVLNRGKYIMLLIYCAPLIYYIII